MYIYICIYIYIYVCVSLLQILSEKLSEAFYRPLRMYISFQYIYIYMYIYMYICIYIYVCVSLLYILSETPREAFYRPLYMYISFQYVHIYVYICTYIYIYIYMCVCVFCKYFQKQRGRLSIYLFPYRYRFLCLVFFDLYRSLFKILSVPACGVCQKRPTKETWVQHRKPTNYRDIFGSAVHPQGGKDT